MSENKHAITKAFTQMVCIMTLFTLLCGCRGGAGSFYHSALGSVTLVAHRDAFGALHKGDFTEARRVLETKLRENPEDPELNYTLGCLDLMQSDTVEGLNNRRAMQSRGWRRVELASGKFYPANKLLAHAFLVGRWGKPRSQDLYVKNLRLSSDGFRSQGGRTNEVELNRRAWALLSPP